MQRYQRHVGEVIQEAPASEESDSSDEETVVESRVTFRPETTVEVPAPAHPRPARNHRRRLPTPPRFQEPTVIPRSPAVSSESPPASSNLQDRLGNSTPSLPQASDDSEISFGSPVPDIAETPRSSTAAGGRALRPRGALRQPTWYGV